uniref:Uncharacterized protein n=1 Tax=Anguilla anguilla TaxID=7936 RepID=A0A0E9UD59_ANGAN
MNLKAMIIIMIVKIQ